MSDQNQILITQQGLESLQNELKALVDEKRPKVVDRLATARAMGDLSENNDYTQAKEELAFVDGRIAELEEVLKNVVVVQKRSDGTIVLGSKVTVKNEGTHVFDIVGEWEADPMQKKISHKSPLGQSLIGKVVGDKVEVDAPAGKISYTVLKVE